jgi:exopolyphosphatase/guanosine-5'-triphosphate,3'-diphosphate pyrophosphatase
MTQLQVTIGSTDVVVLVRRADAASVFGIPFGIEQLSTHYLESDPPRPEELTNAIGAVVDHLDDLVRIDPDVLAAATAVCGPEAEAIAAVELGGAPTLPFELTRTAAEDVFRTLATEPRADRALNPGLDPQLVDRVVAGSCVLVGIMRRLHLDTVTVIS